MLKALSIFLALCLFICLFTSCTNVPPFTNNNSATASIISDVTSTVTPADSSSKASKPQNSSTESKKPTLYTVANRFGNSMSNLSHGGECAAQGDYIYYTGEKAIYQMKKDGTEVKKIVSVNGTSLNVSGDWLYFVYGAKSKLTAKNINGKGQKHFAEGVCEAYFGNNMLYYTDWDKRYLYSIDPFKEDATPKLINKKWTTSINITETKLYYVSENTLYEAKLDGSNPKKCQDVGNQDIIIHNGKVYNNSGICNIDGSNQKPLSAHSYSDPIISGNYIYYINVVRDENNVRDKYYEYIYRMRLDGSKVERISTMPVIQFSVIDDWIIFHKIKYLSSDPDNGEACSEARYKMKTDGTKLELVNTFH